MHAIFSPDSRFMQIMNRVADLLLLNIVYLLTCAPVFTVGAASAALYTVCFRFGTDRERGAVRSYFRAFREHFRQGTVLWLLLLLCAVTACVNAWVFCAMPGALRYACVLFAILFLLALLISGYVFPLLSQFGNDSRSTLRNALILSLGYLPRSVVIAALNVFPFALMLLDFYAFLQAAFLWAALYFSAAAYANTLLLKKVFAPYLTDPAEDDKEELL